MLVITACRHLGNKERVINNILMNSNSSQAIHNKGIKALSLLGLSLLSSYAYSIQELDQFKGANLIKYDQATQVDYALPLANLKKSARTWIPIKAKQVQGELTSSLFKFGRNESLLPIYNFYKKQLTEDSDILYECNGRTCGSSNAWANNFFNDYRLYGADANQYLLVVADESEKDNDYQVLYLNRRGAGDVMLRLDDITTKQDVSKANVALQVSFDDTDKINQFLNGQGNSQDFVVVITTDASLSPVDSFTQGEEKLIELKASLSSDLMGQIRFVNLGNQAKPIYGENQVTVILNHASNNK